MGQSVAQEKAKIPGGPWVEAHARVEELIKNKPGAPVGNTNASKNNAPQRGALKPDPTTGPNRHPKDRKSRLIRTLTNLKDDPEACQAKGTTAMAEERIQAFEAEIAQPLLQANGGKRVKQPYPDQADPQAARFGNKTSYPDNGFSDPQAARAVGSRRGAATFWRSKSRCFGRAEARLIPCSSKVATLHLVAVERQGGTGSA